VGLFVDRARELDWLEARWRSGRAELLLVYGRRRVGKTALIEEWMSRHRGRVFYFVAEEVPEKLLLERLSAELAEFTGDELLREQPFQGWRQVFLYLARASKRERLGFVLDEFQYAAWSSPGLASVLQAVWDTRLRETKAFIVLMGSLVSFTEGVLGQRSPLYGRLTGVLRLELLGPVEAGCFAPRWPVGDRFRLYAALGGVPGYLVEVDDREDLWANLRRLFFEPNARFLDEAKYLLREELREVARYFAVLEAIASGATSYGEIASRSGVPGESLSKYLRVLEEMGLVEKQLPVIGRARARYRIRDPFLRFWFRYIPRYRTAIELGAASRVVEAARRDFEASLAPLAWEEAQAEIVARLAEDGTLGLTPTRMGPWWHRGEEIDLVALDETTSPPRVLVLEAKWATLGCGEARRVLDRLRAKAARLPLPGGAEVAAYVLAARELRCPSPRLLPDEAVVTLETLEELQRRACPAATGRRHV
jgi:AAA+ ATPase superfamily predicted ATPase